MHATHHRLPVSLNQSLLNGDLCSVSVCRPSTLPACFLYCAPFCLNFRRSAVSEMLSPVSRWWSKSLRSHFPHSSVWREHSRPWFYAIHFGSDEFINGSQKKLSLWNSLYKFIITFPAQILLGRCVIITPFISSRKCWEGHLFLFPSWFGFTCLLRVNFHHLQFFCLISFILPRDIFIPMGVVSLRMTPPPCTWFDENLKK